MAKDELHILSDSGGGGGVSIDERSRNVKQKKRGLGIAQLEKLRLEEEMRKRKSEVHLSGGEGSVSSERSRNVEREKVARRGLGVARLEKMRLDEARKRASLNSVYYNNLAANSASPVVNFYILQPAPAVNVDGKNYAWWNNNNMVDTKSRSIFDELPRDNWLSLGLPHSELAADANGEAIDLTLKL